MAQPEIIHATALQMPQDRETSTSEHFAGSVHVSRQLALLQTCSSAASVGLSTLAERRSP